MGRSNSLYDVDEFFVCLWCVLLYYLDVVDVITLTGVSDGC